MVEKGCLVNSLYDYPANMTFFTTSELLEIGDIPFPSVHSKPTRMEALEYYRKVAMHYQLDVRQYQRIERVDGCDGEFLVFAIDEHDGEHRYEARKVAMHYQLDVRQYQRVQKVEGSDGEFRVHVIDQHEQSHFYEARKLIIATGYYDLPNYMNIPGEELPKVFHYYREPHPYYDNDVLVIGGKNSAAIAALELWRHGARVTLVHRGPGMHKNVKYWILPDIENRIKNGEVTAYFTTTVQEIRERTVILRTPEGDREIENDFVFALTGYHPDFDFLRSLGVTCSGEQNRPVCDVETLESNVPGIYLAGVIVAGSRTSEIFIENGRFHGRQIAADLIRKLAAQPVR